jgi:hypothetical protein
MLIAKTSELPFWIPVVFVALWRFWGTRLYLLVEPLREVKQNVDVGCGDRYLFSFVVFRIFNGFG